MPLASTGRDLRAVASGGSVHRGALGRAGARDDVDDTTDRVGPVETGACALDDLDALDRFGLDVLQRRAADGARIDSHPVDQHRGVIAFRAAQEDRGRLSGAAVACYLDAAVADKERCQVARQRVIDLLARDYYDRHGEFIDRGCRSRRGNDDFVQRCRRPQHQSPPVAPRAVASAATSTPVQIQWPQYAWKTPARPPA